MAKKDQGRAGYAWMYGAKARKDAKERAVPEYWGEWADGWLLGFDGVPLDGTGDPKPVHDGMEAEFDETAIDKPAGT